jgi:hypothetical protein
MLDGDFIRAGTGLYINTKSSTTVNGGIRIHDSAETIKGYLYYNVDGYGLLGGNGQWGIRVTPDGLSNIEIPNGNLNVNTSVDSYRINGLGAMEAQSGWLYLNAYNDFTSGVYTGSTILRTDGALQVGTSGDKFLVTAAGAVTAAGSITATGAVTGSNLNVSNWDTAFGWGDHSLAGYTSNTGTVTNVNDGNGMTFTAITGSGDVTMGTPSSITDTSTNAVTTNSHTHAVSHTGTGIFAMQASPTFTGTVTLPATNMADADLNRPVLEDYAVKRQAPTVSANAVTVNCTLGNYATIDMDPATAAVTLTLSNPPASGRYGEVTLEIIMGTPAYGIIWPGSITWLNGGSAPVLTTTDNEVDFVHLLTRDGGTNWYGTYALAAGASGYTHPTHPGDDFSVDTGALTGAVVVSDVDINVTTDTLGHVTDANGVVSTRTLSINDLGGPYSNNAGTVTAVNNGNGMNFTNITTSGTVTLGTPSSITDTSTNSTTASSHTHAVSHTGTGSFVMAGSPTFTTKINTPYMEATALGPNTTPGTDDAYFGGYGVMGSRATIYVSNVAGAVALNHGGVHGSGNTKLATTSGGVTITGTITASGDINANGNIVGDGGTQITGIEQIVVDATADIRKTSHGCYLYHASTAYDNDQNGQVTFGTGAASGGTTGDIHFRYV